ncbi:hypothetical protein LZ198_16865 [Myxococcus sp. K15C18031901]|uniref:hypothetical protein n=1 Tax=Myxococcus dinghuensis TaxID=2906761 RepID=UPI0020A7C859|nr:hypothetical protein [Myxococcus dinghuensis]MCP3100543.1 hypothetical protein [Myxococcus dinghuensis]
MVDAKGAPDWEVRLRAPGQRRWFFSAVLLVWCAIGFAGAKLGLDVLIVVVRKLLDPTPMGGRMVMTNVPAVGLVLGGLLLAAVLTGWLWVGVRFGTFLLRSIVCEDQLAMDSKGVRWRRWWGPWTRVNHLPYADVAAFPDGSGGGVTALLHTGRRVELATLGTVSEHRALYQRLRGRSELGATPAVLADCVPEGREAVSLPRGGVVFRRERGAAVGQRAWMRGGAALLFAASAAGVMWRQGIDGTSVEGPLFAVALAGLAGWVALSAWPSFQSWLEWEVRPGVLERVRYRIGRPERVSHRVRSLEVRRDVSQELGEDERVTFSLWMHTSKGASVLERGIYAPERMDHLGQWLAHRLDVSLDRKALVGDLPKSKPALRRRAG